MTVATAADPSRLAELRAKIDAIDESVHRLLMQRAMVIDELILVKGTARNGAAFRPGREADMMRRLASRHEGHLPITAVEHLWREIISTFTALQAPFDVAVSTGDDPVAAIEAARFTFGFSVPLLALGTAGEVVEWMEEGGDRLGVILLDEEAGAWWEALRTAQIVSRLPFLEVPGREAAAPALVLAPPLADPVPFEIGCHVVTGPREAVSAFIAATTPDILAAEHSGARASILVAMPAPDAPAAGADLDIHAVGGLCGTSATSCLKACAGAPVLLFGKDEFHGIPLARPVPNKGVLDIEAYTPGKSLAPEGVTLHKLSSNETPVGPSPRAREAMMAAAAHLELYPDGQATALKQAIAETQGLNARNILCGNGSGRAFALLCAGYLSHGDEAIHTEHGFLMYDVYIRAVGAKPVVARERDARVDVDAILACVTERTRLVFLANPGNPSGTYVPFEEVRRLHAGLPSHVVLVLDAAYAEYVRRNDYGAGVELVSEAENVVMTRTFSKVHGLAALRIGWMYAPAAIVDALDRIRGPFNINAPAMAAGAAAIRDRAHVEMAVAHNAEWLDFTTKALEALGLGVTPSVANFVLVHFPDEPGRSAAEADAFLTRCGFILRRVAGYGFPNALRLTIGTEEANRGVVEALGAFLSGPPA